MLPREEISFFLKEFRSEILLLLFVFLSSFYLLQRIRRWNREKYPPGPWGLPVVGYLPFISKDAHLKMTQLSKKYGAIFSLKLGSKNAIVLNSTDLLKEAYNKDEFNGRPPHSAFTIIKRKSPFFTETSDIWKEHRRFVLHSMKDLGLGRSKIEGKVQEEIECILDVFRASEGRPIDLNGPLTPSMSNNISALVFNERYNYDDPERKQLDFNLNEGARILGQTTSPIFMPWLQWIPGFGRLLGLHRGIRAFENTAQILKKKIEEHKESLDPKNPRDYIDLYLIESEMKEKKKLHTTFCYDAMLGSITDLFGAGSDTVRSAILWCMYIMSSYKQIQDKVRQEIMDVIGSERSPGIQDQRDMPFTQAVLMEVMRWKTIVPLNVLRCSVENTTLGGFFIPKGTIIFGNFWAVHHDLKLWNKPEEFIPERFLEDDGKTIKKSQHYMPFSVGKHTCPGENMAVMEVFLYFTSILQKFQVQFPDDFIPTNKAILGIAYKPEHYTVQFIAM